MAERTLRNCRILVVEDEYMLADDLRRMLEGVGAIVLGPLGRLQQALSLVEREAEIHGALLDIDLSGEPVFPVADLLIERQVPVVFTTGYDASSIPSRFAGIARCEKPIDMVKVAEAIGRRLPP